VGSLSLLDRPPGTRIHRVNLVGLSVDSQGVSLHPSREQNQIRQTILIVSLLSLFALAVQGFHPYAEDGGLYVAGIKKMLDPSLYNVRPEFVLAPLRFSPFAPTLAGISRMSNLPLPWVLLGLYAASIWGTLFGGWMVVSRCTASLTARYGAISLLACWLSIPIAGTSLMLMDPYVTARSLSTPLTLFAIAWAMDTLTGSWRSGILCAIALTLAVVHPLMATYALTTVVVLLLLGSQREVVRRWGPFLFGGFIILVAAIVQAASPYESPHYVMAVLTRAYWFPLQWQWYELFGLLAPIALLVLVGRAFEAKCWRLLTQTVITLGVLSVVIALCFSRASLSTHLVARLQPLRCFQIVYEVMILLLGAWLGDRWLKRKPWRWALMLTILGGVMFASQRSTYPESAHFEWPGVVPQNLWSQAFLWIRDNTPKDALFALDANYISQDSEDAQSFRSIAERSVLPDYSKDGGETSITPRLADAWFEGETAQTGLDTENDGAREAKLQPLGVEWVVLRRNSLTAWVCPYENVMVKVCALP